MLLRHQILLSRPGNGVSNPDAMAQLRAPIFEDKVVDFLCTQVKIEDNQVSREDLFKDPDELAQAKA